MDVKVLFNSKNAYRVATALLVCAESNLEEILTTDIARSAKVNYATVLYWIGIFETCGFIGTTKYNNRENALCRNTRHIIVHVGDKWKEKLSQLYNYMWIQKWETALMQDLGVEHLTLLQKAV